MRIILFEDDQRDEFLPFVYTRPVGALRIGILTIAEKWQRWLSPHVSHAAPSYLNSLFTVPSDGPGYLINARLIPTKPVVDQIMSLGAGEVLHYGSILLAGRYVNEEHFSTHHPDRHHEALTVPFLLNRASDLFSRNGEALQLDFDLLTGGRSSHEADSSFRLVGPPNRLFVEQGAVISEAVINVKDGPVYLAAHAEVMEGALIRGPFSLGEHAQVKMGAKVYGPTTIGPYCKVGGEVSNSVLLGYSNKGHDGFLGNSVIGEWCNLGADSNTSNLKNNYSSVKTWNFRAGEYRDSGLTFCGLLMGDHSRSGINTMFNTGTVTGVAANVFGSGFPPKFIPSFSWGGAEGMEEYRLNEALSSAERMMARRNIPLTEEMRLILTEVFRMTTADRRIRTLRQD